MALVTNSHRVSSYFASLGELASKIVHEADGIRQSYGEKWTTMSTAQKEQVLDEHFIDESVRTYYASRTAVEQQKRASRMSGAALHSGDRSAGEGPPNPNEELPTYEMLFPRPVRTTGKFVQGGVTDESETSRGTFTYVDEFAGDFSWETKSQLELWLPEGQKLPSPRSVRRSVKDESEPHGVSFASQPHSEEAAVENGGVPSVRAMAQALQRTSIAGNKGAAVGGRAILTATNSNTPPVSSHKPKPPSRTDSISASSRTDALRPSTGTAGRSPSPAAPRPATNSISKTSNDSGTNPETARSTDVVQHSPPSTRNAPDSSSTKLPVSAASSVSSIGGGSSPRAGPPPPTRRDSLVKARPKAATASGSSGASSEVVDKPSSIIGTQSSNVTSHQNKPEPSTSTSQQKPEQNTSTFQQKPERSTSTSQQKPKSTTSGGAESARRESNISNDDLFSSLGMKSMLSGTTGNSDDKKTGFDFLDNW